MMKINQTKKALSQLLRINASSKTQFFVVLICLLNSIKINLIKNIHDYAGMACFLVLILIITSIIKIKIKFS